MKCLVLLFLLFGVAAARGLNKRVMATKDGSLCRARGGACATAANCACNLPVEDADCPVNQRCCTACSGSSPTFAASCGMQNYVSRIVGGNVAIRGTYPWMGLVLMSGSLRCGAAMINNQWLISAAHCYEGALSVTRFNVTMGAHDRTINNGAEQKFQVDKIVVHPEYDDDEILNDIALIKIKGSATWNQWVSPICVPNDGTNLAGMNCPVIGWGRTTENGVSSNILREVTIPILTDAACVAKFPRDNVVPASQICAGVNGGNKDSCQGDSGGPLNCNMNGTWIHAGITSWGYGCLNGGVYTRVSHFKSWVQSVISVL